MIKAQITHLTHSLLYGYFNIRHINLISFEIPAFMPRTEVEIALLTHVVDERGRRLLFKFKFPRYALCSQVIYEYTLCSNMGEKTEFSGLKDVKNLQVKFKLLLIVLRKKSGSLPSRSGVHRNYLRLLPDPFK